MNYPITFHKTVVLVTFSGKCNKNLSQKVILWQTLWQNLLKVKKSNHNREITNIVVFNFEESRIQLVWDFCLKLQVRYNLLNIRLLFPDAARHELSKVISAHDNHHWLSTSYEGVLSQLWQNRDFCDKNCDKTVAQNCSNCDKNLNFSGWKKKMALSQSSEMCRDKVIFSFSKTRLFYLETFQVHSLFPAFKS